MQPIPGVRLTVISTDVHTPYSGMLPGYVAGHYGYDDVHIDLSRLAVFANARLYRDEVIGLDRVNRKVLCRNRPPVPYDVLSINTGSTPQLQNVPGAADNAHILPTHNESVHRTFEMVLAARGVQVHRHAAVTQVAPARVLTSSGEEVHADEIVWVTRAGGANWLKDTGLALDADGFIQVTDTLQTGTDPNIFAAGDVASMVNHPLEKAGVFAVRQGPPLARNLRLQVQGAMPKPYRPQRRWLALISTGDQYAVASRGWLGFSGAWVNCTQCSVTM